MLSMRLNWNSCTSFLFFLPFKNSSHAERRFPTEIISSYFILNLFIMSVLLVYEKISQIPPRHFTGYIKRKELYHF